MSKLTHQRARRNLEQAASLLREIVLHGYGLYLDGGGNVHVMDGPTHDDDGRPLRENSIGRESVPGFEGGDW